MGAVRIEKRNNSGVKAPHSKCFAGLAADPRSAPLIPALEMASEADRKLNRRFRTVSDAALWLAEHHPEIDLDKPYNKK